MKNIYALGRLMWRPASLLLLFPLALSVAFPLTESGAALAAGAHPLFLRAMWRFVVLFGVFGFMVSIYGRELKRGLFVWNIPDVDAALLKGAILLALLFLVPVAAILARSEGAMMGIAALGGGLLAYALGFEIQDALRPNLYRGAVLLALVLLLWRPEAALRAAGLSPLLFAVTTAAAGLFLLWQSSSPRASRQRPFATEFGFVGSAEAMRLAWARKKTREDYWTRSLSKGSVASWIAAGYYETFTRSGSWFRMLLVQAIWGGFFIHQMSNPPMAPIIAGPSLLYSGIQTKMSFPYPLSREERGTLFYLSALLENIGTTLAAAAGIWVFYSIDIPRFLFEPELPAFTAGRAAVFALFPFAFAPIVQWGKVRGVPEAGRITTLPRKNWGSQMGYQFVYALVAMGATIPFIGKRHASFPTMLLTLAVTAIIAQMVFYLAVKRHFRKGDL